MSLRVQDNRAIAVYYEGRGTSCSITVLVIDTKCRCSYIGGLVQDCSISIANALEILQSCTKPSIISLKTIPGDITVIPELTH